MSCLSKRHRLNSSRDFSLIYKSGKKWHTHSFVAFFQDSDELKIAFVSSKKVGGAVVRNRARRRIRSLLLDYEDKIKTGKYIFVAKDKIADRSHLELHRDFKFAMKRLELFK